MYKGGDNGGAANFMLNTVGNGEQQFDNVMNSTSNSNVILPLQSSTSLVNSAPVNINTVGGQKGGKCGAACLHGGTTSPTGVPSNNAMMGNGMMGNGMMGKGMMGKEMMKEGWKGGGRGRKGGFFGMGSVINQAIVPFGILAMQQSYGRKRHGSTSSRGTKRRFR
jgi:hypothetical protein